MDRLPINVSSEVGHELDANPVATVLDGRAVPRALGRRCGVLAEENRATS